MISFNINAQNLKVLIFSKTTEFRHNSIGSGIVAIQKLGSENDFLVDVTEDATKFTFDNLSDYGAVIFLSTTGNVLNATQQGEFEKYIQSGGGYVGIHAASDTEYDWPWYGDLVGAYFDFHPSIQTATIEVADKVHPSTKNLPEYWQINEEWYNFQRNPRGKVHVLATVDESTYSGGSMGYDHPIAWCHEFDGGRAWYTGIGHNDITYIEKDFLDHLLGGILYASGKIKGDFEAGIDDRFEITVIDNNPVSPMQLAVLPDLSVLYIERAGKVKVKDIDSGIIKVAGTIPVANDLEDGLLGVVLDPDFKNNNWIYFFYSPIGSSVQNISRFKFNQKELDLSSEQIILTIPIQREQCCHSGGDLEFDGEGNLYISTGDNVDPFEADGFAPIDERSGRVAFDAQGTSGNTDDLRGKILRIHPEDNGTYTIPDGNLFANSADGKSEIYVMGTRNPFRMAVNKLKRELVWGDVGPDATEDNPDRGPKGYDEFNKTNTSGNFGWPYFVANNKAYKDYDFNTQSSGNYFDPNNLINNSPNNTGTSLLPPAIPAWLYYPYDFFSERPEFESAGGRAAAAGDYCYFDPNSNNGIGFPEYYDNSLFIMEWARSWIREVRFDESGNLLQINKFLPDLELNSPIDMHFGPDGAMYLVEWGTGFTNANPDARILKISFKGKKGNNNNAPQAKISVSIDNGFAPLSVDFTGDESSDPDESDQLTYSWDFNNDGTEDANTPNATFVYENEGEYIATLTVSDQDSLTSTTQVAISVGDKGNNNNAPQAKISISTDNGFAPLQVDFTGDESSDPDEGDQLTYSWDFNGDGVEDANTPNTTYIYEIEGKYIATLTVSDQDSLASTTQVAITVGKKGEGNNNTPLAEILVSTDNGFAPLQVDFTGDESSDPDEGDELTYSWDFDGDGIEDANTPNTTFVYEKEGIFIATLTVSDQDSLSSKSQVTITVGNTSPEISIEYPLNGGFYTDGDTILYKVTATDGGEKVNCDEILVEPSIGHNEHAHGIGANLGCEGSFITESHGVGPDNIFYVINASYEDDGGTVGEPIKVETVHVLQKKLKQAEHAQELFDLKPEATQDYLGGGKNIGFINHNSYLKFSPTNFTGIKFLTVRYASESNPCWLEVHIDSVEGPTIASGKLSPTGGLNDYNYFTMSLTNTVGTHDVFMVFKNPINPVGLGKVNWFEFHGKGIATSDPDAGKGLVATYFNNSNFTGDSIQQKEPMIAWNWEDNNPIPNWSKDNFSVRWRGQIMAPNTGEYTVYLEQTNGEATVWIDNSLIIFKGINSGKFEFIQNQPYNLVVEYTHTTGEAGIKLQWEGPQPKNVIHTQYLIDNYDGVISGIEDEILPEYQVYPNPVADFLYLDQALYNKNYILRNLSGVQLEAGKVKEKISTQKLIPGIYLLEIEGYRVKLIKF